MDKVRETYAVPADYGVVAGIALGYQGELESLPEHRQEPETALRSRNPLSDMIFPGTFGNSSPLVAD